MCVCSLSIFKWIERQNMNIINTESVSGCCRLISVKAKYISVCFIICHNYTRIFQLAVQIFCHLKWCSCTAKMMLKLTNSNGKTIIFSVFTVIYYFCDIIYIKIIVVRKCKKVQLDLGIFLLFFIYTSVFITLYSKFFLQFNYILNFFCYISEFHRFLDNLLYFVIIDNNIIYLLLL